MIVRLPWQRRPQSLPLLPRAETDPPVQVRKIAGEEVAQVRAEARREFEKVLPAATTKRPDDATLDRWYGGR